MSIKSKTFDTVIVISDYASIKGGREKVAVESALGLARAGIRTIYFCAIYPVDPRLEAAGVRVVSLDLPEITEFALGSIGEIAKRAWNSTASRQLKSLLSECDPKSTIVHVHGIKSFISPSIMPVITDPGVRRVWTMHDYGFFCPNNVYFNFSSQQICTLKPTGPACIFTQCDRANYLHKLFRISQHAVMRFAGLSRLHHLICFSQTQKKAIEHLLPEQAELHLVPNPVTQIQETRVSVENNQNFVFAGRMTKEKGVMDLAEASKGIELPLVFVGDGPAADDVKRINPVAKVTGWMPVAEVSEHLRKARCLIFPSMWLEGQPLIIHQALSMGVPVVCYDTSTAIDCVTDGVNGEVVPIQSGAAGLRSRMEKYMDPDFAKMQSQNAYDGYWASPMTLEKHVRRLIEVYEAI